MRILFTGGSSFTGLHFVSALRRQGHEIICPLRDDPQNYRSLRGARVGELKKSGQVLGPAPFGSPAFLDSLKRAGPFDLLCHHAADVANYKSADFDPIAALKNNTEGIAGVLDTFAEAGGKGVVLTGTVFEPDEGDGDQPLRAFSPYGLSKGLTWQVFRYYCHARKLGLGKFVIPNPFGSWEEARFTSYLMRTWKAGGKAAVKTPDYVRDNIHADLLAMVYALHTAEVLAAGAAVLKSNPSGYVETQGEFAKRVASETRQRTPWKCELELSNQTDFPEPCRRTNLTPARGIVPRWNEKSAWDDFVKFYVESDLA
jgi:UDP-glucose 4-epimerase